MNDGEPTHDGGLTFGEAMIRLADGLDIPVELLSFEMTDSHWSPLAEAERAWLIPRAELAVQVELRHIDWRLLRALTGWPRWRCCWVALRTNRRLRRRDKAAAARAAKEEQR